MVAVMDWIIGLPVTLGARVGEKKDISELLEEKELAVLIHTYVLTGTVSF